MAEEVIETMEQEDNGVQKYIDTIDQLKKTTVSRDKYDAVMKENSDLLRAIATGTAIENSSAEQPQKPTVAELRKKLYGQDTHGMTDLEYVSTVLEMRDLLIDEKGIDPFIPAGSKYTPTYEDQRSAENLAECLQHCVDVADGDNSVFIRELTRITTDTPNIKTRKR